ncbi:MAG TPA: MdtA/MuxA family multidrug efflux RND transporter periplasmic adaptor subunit [Candidatus Dormibacteraeota bacterium]|nr:MdtA/MuxA family multidrug efflux RND transporter periplasmic adaptor subunit [Candidatus Dormibacteraeota bacterium]
MGPLKSLDLPESDAQTTHAASPEASHAASRAAFHGTSRPRWRWWLWLLALVVLAGGFWYYRGTRSSAQTAGVNSANAAGKGKAGGPAANFSVPVVVATAQNGDLPVYFNGLGTVTAFNTVTVHSRVDGQLISIAFKEGQFVHQGNLLGQIDPRAFQVALEQAQGQLAKDEAQRRDAQVNFERYKTLFEEGIAPKQQMDTQQAQLGQFEGAIKTDQATINSAKLQLSYSRITAPISGRIGLRLVDVGNMVHANDPNGLLVITQLQPISVIFSLPQDQLPPVATKLRSGAQLPVEAYDRDDTAKIATGKLATIDNQIDIATGTFKLKAIFSNENNVLFPNQFVNVHLLVDIKRNLTIVPTVAILRGPQGPYVYAVENGNTAKIRNVSIAMATNNSTGLTDGLHPGDVVVIDGHDKLQDGSKVNATSSSGVSSGVSNGGDARTPGAPVPAPQGRSHSGSPSTGQPAGAPR